MGGQCPPTPAFRSVGVDVELVLDLLLEVSDGLGAGLVASGVLAYLTAPDVVDSLIVLVLVRTSCELACGNEHVEHVLSAQERQRAVGDLHDGPRSDGILGAAGPVEGAVRPEVLQTGLGAVQGDPLDHVADDALQLAVLVGDDPGAAPEEADRRFAHGPVTIGAFAGVLATGVSGHDVVDEPRGAEEAEDLLGTGILHVGEPGVSPVLGVVVIAVVLQLLGEIQEGLAVLVDEELAVDDPALLGAAFDGVPDVPVAGDDAVALGLQRRSRLEELVPPRSDLGLDHGRIVRAEDVLRDGAAIDERSAGGLIAETNELLRRRVGADVDRVLGDVGLLQKGGHVDPQVLVRSGELARRRPACT